MSLLHRPIKPRPAWAPPPRRRKQAAVRKAKSELDDARKTKQAAAKTRADADRLGDLTDAK